MSQSAEIICIHFSALNETEWNSFSCHTKVYKSAQNVRRGRAQQKQIINFHMQLQQKKERRKEKVKKQAKINCRQKLQNK